MLVYLITRLVCQVIMWALNNNVYWASKNVSILSNIVSKSGKSTMLNNNVCLESKSASLSNPSK